MKKVQYFIAIVVTFTFLGCNPSWWQSIQDNPAAYASSLEQHVQTFLATASIIFKVLSPLLPPDKRFDIENRYNEAVLIVNHAISTLNDVVNIAEEAKHPNPDLTKEIASVTQGVDHLMALVTEVKGYDKKNSPSVRESVGLGAPPPWSVYTNIDLRDAFYDIERQHALIHLYRERHEKQNSSKQ